MNNSLLQINDLTRFYERGNHTVKAIDGVNFKIEKGEFLAVVGSSGSGKSTLLNLLAGLDSPTSGDIKVYGTSINNMNRKERANYRAAKVGMVFQSFNLIPHYTALRNVEMALYFNNTPHEKRTKMAMEILDKLGLSDRLDHLPADLSGGEQQRVAMARALVKKPEILFADEPTGNLDQENTKQLANVLNDLHQQGITVVMVTHDSKLAEENAKRIIKMEYGKIVEDRNPENVS